jgi:hypothetical protein
MYPDETLQEFWERSGISIVVHQSHFLEAMQNFVPSVSPVELDRYRKLREELGNKSADTTRNEM